jgi:hypothetical protein
MLIICSLFPSNLHLSKSEILNFIKLRLTYKSYSLLILLYYIFLLFYLEITIRDLINVISFY